MVGALYKLLEYQIISCPIKFRSFTGFYIHSVLSFYYPSYPVPSFYGLSFFPISSLYVLSCPIHYRSLSRHVLLNTVLFFSILPIPERSFKSRPFVFHHFSFYLFRSLQFFTSYPVSSSTFLSILSFGILFPISSRYLIFFLSHPTHAYSSYSVLLTHILPIPSYSRIFFLFRLSAF